MTKRKIKVWLHCLIRFHRRGVVHCENEDGTKRWTHWVCADCAKKFVAVKQELTTSDIGWAERALKKIG